MIVVTKLLIIKLNYRGVIKLDLTFSHKFNLTNDNKMSL